MNIPKSLIIITPLSIILAGVLFITLPFLGFYLGMEYEKAKDQGKEPSYKNLEQIKSEIGRCVQSSDCIVVDYKDCCASKKAINKEYRNIYYQYPQLQGLSKERQDICTRIECDDATRDLNASKCEDNLCILIKSSDPDAPSESVNQVSGSDLAD